MQRYFPALVSFAIATALVTHARALPEFFVQLGDPNLLGGGLLRWMLVHFGYAFVLGVCAALAAAAVLLAAWNVRLRGARDLFAALAALLAGLAMTMRLGVSLDVIGWFFAAAFMLQYQRKSVNIITSLLIVALWSVLQGGASLAALLALLVLAGEWIDARTFDVRICQCAIIAAGALLAGAFQLHALPWHAYGPHALYLDSLLPGAQRDHVWTGSLTVNSLAFSLLLIVAGWYGVRRRGRTADALVFFALMLLTMIDVRNLPYFGLLAGPIVADAVASFYVDTREIPEMSFSPHVAAFIACAVAFIATIVATEPKATHWPIPPGQPQALFSRLASDGHVHRVLCESPRWCDGADSRYANIRVVVDDRGGLASAQDLRIEHDTDDTTGHWRAQLAKSSVNAIVARNDAIFVAPLLEDGWHSVQLDGERVLLVRERAE